MSFRVVFFSLAQHEITCTANQHWDEINMKCGLSVRSFFFFFDYFIFEQVTVWNAHDKINLFAGTPAPVELQAGSLKQQARDQNGIIAAKDDQAFGLHLVGQDCVGIQWCWCHGAHSLHNEYWNETQPALQHLLCRWRCKEGSVRKVKRRTPSTYNTRVVKKDPRNDWKASKKNYEWRFQQFEDWFLHKYTKTSWIQNFIDFHSGRYCEESERQYHKN